jgi:CubicO group peptidase (beta-lactamase class C family)
VVASRGGGGDDPVRCDVEAGILRDAVVSSVSVEVDGLQSRVNALIAESRFSGVVRVDRAGETVLERAVGWAHRAHLIPMTVDTRLAMASGSKGLTALVVLSLVGDGTLALTTPARELLGDDLPLVDDRVTIEQLLAHRSGIGDYLDESAVSQIDDYVLSVPVHTLAESVDYLSVLEGHPQRFVPGERFDYNNAGFVILALLAERAASAPFADLVQQRVCEPANMIDTAYLRSDALPARTALGYLDAECHRSNVLHLPVRGSGDGGAYTTVADVHRLWLALRAGAVVDPAALAIAWRPRSEVPAEDTRYGLGFWVHASGPGVFLEGYDAGVSFRTVFDPESDTTHTVLANWSNGAWPLARALYLDLLRS